MHELRRDQLRRLRRGQRTSSELNVEKGIGRAQRRRDSPDICEFLSASLRDGWKRFRKRLKRCRENFSEKAVHNSRIESRRLLSLCELVSALTASAHAAKVRHCLKRYLDTFDELRDTHVQLTIVGKRLRRFPVLRPFHNALRKLERHLLKDTARRVRRTKLSCLRKSIRSMEDELRGRAREKAPRTQFQFGAVCRALHQSFSQVVALHRCVDPTDTATIHRVRIAFKKFRYVIEAIAPMLPGVTAQRLAAMKRFQVLMGELQDTEVLLATVKKFRQKNKVDAGAASDFRETLLRRRQRLIGAYLKRADQLDQFRLESNVAGNRH